MMLISDIFPVDDAKLSKFQNQGGKSWQPFGEGKNGHKSFCHTRIYFFATNASFLRVITKGLVPFTRLVKVRRGKGRFPEKR